MGIDKLYPYNIKCVLSAFNYTHIIFVGTFVKVCVLGGRRKKMSENKNHKLAEDILKAIGGDSNVSNSTHCATRLRLVLKEENEETVNAVKEVPGVIDVVRKGGQFQIVIGNSVDKVYSAFTELTGESNDPSQGQPEEKGSLIDRVIATMSAVFAPFVYILASAGMIQGALIILSSMWPEMAETGTFQVFDIISWAPFTFLPIFIAITASKHFKSNTYIAVFANAALVAPEFTALAESVAEGEMVGFLGTPLSETVYTSTVIPALLLVWFLSYLEKWVEKILPEAITRLFTPLISILVAVPLTILILGPLSTAGANAVAEGYTWLSQSFPAVAGIIVGGFWQFFVLLGVHWGITPVVLANHAQYGMDTFQAYQTIAVVAQVGAVLGVYIKAKKQAVKSISLSAIITGIFGITEPAIYGVNLRYKKPFFIGIVSGAIGAFVASFFGVYSFVYTGIPSMITIMNNYHPDYPGSFWGVLIGIIIAIVLPVVLVQFVGYGEDAVEEEPQTDEKKEQMEQNIQKGSSIEVYPPLKGTRVKLPEVPDPVFASGAMGEGIAIEPLEQQVFAPFDGEVTMVAESGHAIGLTSDTGVELLIHVGLETVELKGEPFTVHVKEGQSVKRGDKLMDFNINKIEDAGYHTVIPVIVTNTNDFSEVVIGESEENDKPLITLKK